MSSRKRKHEPRDPAKRAGTAQRAPARPSWLLLLLALAAVVAAVVLLVKSGDSSRPQASPAGATETGPPTTAPATGRAVAPAAVPAPEVLVGRWQRTDGDYALDIRRVHADGRAEVAYSNPGPINVSRAEVRQEGTRRTLFVELRDVNYPGATYKLAYEPGQDALVGEYYQPALGQTYEVGFMRAK